MEVRECMIVDKIWGHEEIIVNNERYCGKKIILNEGFRCSIHRHPKDETFYIESGMVLFELENDRREMEERLLERGDIIHIIPNRKHRFNGMEDSVIIEFSTSNCESERFEESGEIPDFVNFKMEVIENA